AFAAAHAERAQRVGEAICLLAQFGEGPAAALRPRGHTPAAPFLDVAIDDVRPDVQALGNFQITAFASRRGHRRMLRALLPDRAHPLRSRLDRTHYPQVTGASAKHGRERLADFL